MILALAILPIIAVVGSAIDLNRIHTAKSKITMLLDQSVLAATNLNSTEDPSELVQTWMHTQIVDLGYAQSDLNLQVSSVVAINSKSVTATATLNVDTAIMHIFGTDSADIRVSSTAVQSIPNS